MNLNLHPNAVKYFNENGESLLKELIVKSRIPQNIITNEKSSKGSFKPDVFISAHITEKEIIGRVNYGYSDILGNTVGKCFRHLNNDVELVGESYKKLSVLSEKLNKTKTLQNIISKSTLEDLIFSWIEIKYKNETKVEMIGYIEDKCQKEIAQLEIWLPIASLQIESNIQIGKIILKTITREMIDRWHSDWDKAHPEYKDKNKLLFDKERKIIQSYAAATIELIAEPKRAYEIATEEAEKSIGILRYFSYHNFHPLAKSYLTLLGKENMETSKHLLIKENKLISLSTHSFGPPFQPLFFNNEIIKASMASGLDILSNLLLNDSKTNYQKNLIDSLLLYSKSSLSKEPSDKLIYILAALELILLKNENEPIQQNIAERIAFIVGNTVDDRKKIIKNFKEVYSIRSSFVHHGHRIEDIEVLKTFMYNIWLFYNWLIKNAYNFETKDHLIEKIETRKLS